MEFQSSYSTKIGLEDIVHAQMHLKDVITRTPLQYNRVLSERYGTQRPSKT